MAATGIVELIFKSVGEMSEVRNPIRIKEEERHGGENQKDKRPLKNLFEVVRGRGTGQYNQPNEYYGKKNDGIGLTGQSNSAQKAHQRKKRFPARQSVNQT